MKTYLVYPSELHGSDNLALGVTSENLGMKEVVELPEVEHVLDARIEELKNAQAELEAVRVLLEASPRQSAVAAALKVRRETERRHSLADAGADVVID